MSYHCDIVEVRPVVLALTAARLRPPEVPSRIRGLFDIVYRWRGDSEARQTGHNYALYDQFGPDGMRIRVGFPVAEPFPDGELVQCVVLEGGRAAHTRHTGPYQGLAAAYAALTAWCKRESHQLAGESWEVYGDWHDDVTKVVTDLYFRLRPAGGGT